MIVHEPAAGFLAAQREDRLDQRIRRDRAILAQPAAQERIDHRAEMHGQPFGRATLKPPAAQQPADPKVIDGAAQTASPQPAKAETKA